MFIHKLHLKNFRLFQDELFEFEQQATLLLGPNAVGKSSVIEAIHLLSAGKSFRAAKVEEMITFQQDLGRVKGKILPTWESFGAKMGGLDQLQLSILLTRGELNGKRTRKQLYRVNDNKRRKKDFVGKLLTVTFRPEDMRLIEGSPGRRRDFLDLPLQLTDQYYDQAFTQYFKALRRRNKLLSLIKEGEQSDSVLTYWDMSLVKHGEKLQKKRRKLIDFINSRVEAPFEMRINYQPSLISRQRIDSHRSAAIGAGFTLIGPHKDDFEVELNLTQPDSKPDSAEESYRSLDAYGSRGQKRMGVLWLKKAELIYLKAQTKQQPVLLLDDILSELDQHNRALVLDLIDGEQTIITTASSDLIEEIKIKFGKLEVVDLEKRI